MISWLFCTDKYLACRSISQHQDPVTYQDEATCQSLRRETATRDTPAYVITAPLCDTVELINLASISTT